MTMLDPFYTGLKAAVSNVKVKVNKKYIDSKLRLQLNYEMQNYDGKSASLWRKKEKCQETLFLVQ